MTAKEFWDWFDVHKEKLEAFLNGTMEDFTPYLEMTQKAEAYSDLVKPEMGWGKEKKYRLVLSVDGLKKGIPYVETLVNAAPQFEHWEIEKFRQPATGGLIQMQGLTLAPEHIKIRIDKAGELCDITFMIKGYNPNDSQHMTAAFLYLDHLIGEYNVMTRIGVIDFKSPGLFMSSRNVLTLEEFRDTFNRQYN